MLHLLLPSGIAVLIVLASVFSLFEQAHAIPPADFVIVGAGTAGCTIAGRLCDALPRATVTLIERGAPRSRTSRLQSSAARLILDAWANPNLTANYPTAPNRGLNNRTLGALIGANYGGGSAVNAAQLLLPPSGTFRSWRIANLSDARAEALFARLRRTFLAGTGVPPRNLRQRYNPAWLGAAASAGLPFANEIYDAPRNKTISFLQRIAFDQTGRRVDACRAFVRPVRKSCGARLRVLRGAHVERILFKRGRVARSVVVSLPAAESGKKKGRKMRVFARREILVAAGAIESATLLQRSGLGGRAGLPDEQRRMRVIADLPVGRTLQSRAGIAVMSRYEAPLAPVNEVVSATADSSADAQALRAGRGGPLAKSPLGAMGRLGGVGYMTSQHGFTGDASGQKMIGTICAVDASRRSTGFVRTGRGARDPPLIDLRLLEKKEDVDRAASCVRKMRDLHAGLGAAGLAGATEVFSSGLGARQLESQDGLRAKVRAEAFAFSHFVGTCPVGDVVDGELRVRGVSRLRVVDSSVLSTMPRSCGPLASVYIVAMHAAELIAKAHSEV